MAAELVGGALLSSLLEVVFDRLVSRQVLDYFRGRNLDEKLLNKLKVKLLSINAVVDDAEQKQIQNPHVRDWLLEVKDAAFDAEDLLDEIHCEAFKCDLQPESKTPASKVWNFFNTFSVTSFDKEIESRMKQVLDTLEFLSSLKGDLGLKEVAINIFGSKVSQKLPSTSLVVESVIYGRDDDREMIFNWLKSDDVADNCNQLSILSIVGMGGMGKTTLAQHVYNDPRMEEANFDIKAWVCVSDDFDVLRITRAILEAITKSKDDGRDLEMVHGRLKERLTGKRFLLVLDDVWNEKREKWEAVQTPLNYGGRGSRILVTTRSEKVAYTTQSNKVHLLKQLQEDHCWHVFSRHAFRHDIPQLNAELKEIGIKIVEKCKGLPLALKTIGSLLHTKSSVSEWESVLTSKIWDLVKEDCEIIPALFLSYHHLPAHLKRCFSFCAVFPKDYVFVKKGLIQLWMGENFLQCPQQSKSPEEVGEQYFDDLLSRSFFQQSSNVDTLFVMRSFFQQSSDDDTLFVMHDLLNDLAKYVCGNICFRLGVDDKAKTVPKASRHFSFATNHLKYFDGFGSSCDTKRLRTFMPITSGMYDDFFRWHCKISIQELFSKFKFLRVLSLSVCFGLTEVPDFVGNLKHLCSLDLSRTGIKKLPDSICSLYNLQILKLNRCRNLEELPSNLFKLTNLRCLEFDETKVRKVQMHLGKLKNLQVLSTFCVGKSSEFGIQQLGELNLRGSLSIEELQNIENPSDALAADLKNKIHLVELNLGWNWIENQIPDDARKEREVLEKLQPSKHLKRLSISNYGGTQFPSMLFDNVVHLNLDSCKYCLCLPSLGGLSFLKTLMIRRLDEIVSIDASFYGNSSSSFTSLETLEFEYMKEWEEWECKAVTGAFPRLRSLSIDSCPKLKGHLPEQLLRLEDLYLSDCKQLVASAPRAPEICALNLRDCGKVQFDYHPTTLKSLTIWGQSMEASSLETIGQIISNTCLESLDIDSCPNMNIPMIHAYHFLVSLTIECSCESLTTFPLDFFPKLGRLDLSCPNLQMISQEQAHNHLKDLTISGCPRFESFPSEGLSAPSLESLSIQGSENLKSFATRMHILLPSLGYLCIENCPKVESFPVEGLPSNLERIGLSNCDKLVASLKGALGANTSLKSLWVGNLDVESFPDEGLLPLSLELLEIYDCPNLKTLDYKGLCQLSSLKELTLDNNPSLQCLPEEGLPKSISTLRISGNCPLLKQRCLEPKGEDWGKILRIEKVWVDHEPIR